MMTIPPVTTKNSRPCLICGEVVAPSSQMAHLQQIHPGPFVFWHDARRFTTHHPSMLVADLKHLVGCTVSYHLYQELDGKNIPFNDGNAVDLTREPHFYSLPPATF